MKALIINADNFEDSELLVPYYRLKEVDIEVAVASLSRGAITGRHGYEVAVDKTLNEVNPDDYAVLVLPGGPAERDTVCTGASFWEKARTGPVVPPVQDDPGGEAARRNWRHATRAGITTR